MRISDSRVLRVCFCLMRKASRRSSLLPVDSKCSRKAAQAGAWSHRGRMVSLFMRAIIGRGAKAVGPSRLRNLHDRDPVARQPQPYVRAHVEEPIALHEVAAAAGRGVA